MSAPLPGDRSAGYVGLAVAAAILLLMLGGIVKWTNLSYASHERAPAAQHR